MRKSQLALLAALGLVVGLMLVVAAWVGIVAEPMPELTGERASRTYDYTGFDGVEVGSQWNVTVERGDAWRVAIDVPAELGDDVEVELRGDRLLLGFDGGWWSGGFRDGVLRATITTPALESVEISGASNVSFSGFDGASLTLNLSGAGQIRGTSSRFDTLALDMSGAVNVELGDVPVTNANVDVSGVGNVTLRMAGGRLTGDVSGAASLEYFGTVSEESVDRSGFVNVRRRN